MEHPEVAFSLAAMQVICRNGNIVSFKSEKISAALTKAFIAVKGEQCPLSSSLRDVVAHLTETVISSLTHRFPDGGSIHIEDIQDQVELALMRSGEHDVARAYVLYREKRAAMRNISEKKAILHIVDKGEKKILDHAWLMDICQIACKNLNSTISPTTVFDNTLKSLYDGMSLIDVYSSLTLSARTMIEYEPEYNKVTARLLRFSLAYEVFGESMDLNKLTTATVKYFPKFIELGVNFGLLDPRLSTFDYSYLAKSLVPERDELFGYMGIQTLYDRYFLHIKKRRIELPQLFFMRVAMGLAINETNKEDKAIEFYNLLSCFDFMSSTPTLFNSGTIRPQLSSCFLTTINDDLEDIFQSIKENALLQKYAGGIGNDWTPVRALGSPIKGTNGQSQGVIPFMKVANDTALAVNQGGKRKGAVCAYLEIWHLDIEDFLDLRKNTGDDRRRTHDMNTAAWVPDLFMKRVLENGDWTLFSPNDVPELHEKFGLEFEKAYTHYEAKTLTGEIILFKKVPAVQLWRKMLTMLFETGHPWITFKDACNLRSPQQHVGVIHSSNLCTEITLNTSKDEIAVCNLGSINLSAHLVDGELDQKKLSQTITTALRMLDNVIDINYYNSPKASHSNLQHRPIGIGIMGFADCLYKLGIPYASHKAVEFADRSMEIICYYAYWASTELAKERGPYSTFSGSLWDRGILPLDSLELLFTGRGGFLEVDQSSCLDWDALKAQIAKYGMRNSNCVSLAPTATISNIIGVSQGIEPAYQNLYVKSNMSGEFTVVNEYLVNDLKKLNLWDEAMVADLKYFDGSVAQIDRVPDLLKQLYATAFEIDPIWLIEAASRRQKWIDQAQSLNLYLDTPSGKKMDEIYKLAWLRGLKTTYYLRSLGASQVEKVGTTQSILKADAVLQVCSINDPECEACQ